MSYNNAIPQATDLISNSQPQILENFSQLDKQYGTAATTSGGAGIGDHVGFSSGSNNGQHIQIRFPNAATEPTLSGTASAIFPLLNAATGQQELYFKNSASEYGGSGKTLLTGPFTASGNGSAYLTGGIIVKWGSATVTNNQSVSFSSAFPNNCFSVVLQPINAGAVTVANDYVYVASVSTSGFSATAVRRITLAGNTVTFYYIAIGN